MRHCRRMRLPTCSRRFRAITARMAASTASPELGSWEMFTDRHRTAFWAAAGIGLAAGVHLLAKRLKI